MTHSVQVSFQIKKQKQKQKNSFICYGILWHFRHRLPIAPESPADSFSFMCAHLPHSQCHECEPHNTATLDREKNCDWLAVTEVTFAVQQPRLSYLLIITCAGLGGVFSQPRYEIATLAALEWFGNEREAPQIWIGGEMMSLTF